MKKTKKYFIYSTIIVLFTALFFSCKNDIENAVASLTSSPEREVAAAQEWYDSYKSRLGAEPVSIGFAKVKSTKQNMPALPDWKHTYTINDKDYSVVHVQLNTKGIFSFVTPENKQAYEVTGNAKYIKTLTRMVVVNDKKNKVKHGFLMTLVPDKSYIESTHFDALRSNYRQWQKGYSGYVFYHTLDGKFNNAWRFENGKVTKEVTQQLSTDLNLDMGIRKKAAADYCIYTTYEIWSQNCMDYYSNSEYSFSNCSEWYYDYSITTQECYETGDGGYTGGTGGTSGGGSASISYITTSISAAVSSVALCEATEILLNKCDYMKMYNYLTGINAKINNVYIDPNMTGLGSYNSSSKDMTFQSNNSIYLAMQEEFVHFFQDNIYANGTAQYTGTGFANIEFEAKLIEDLVRYINNLPGLNYGDPTPDSSNYSIWLDKVTNSGTHFPSYAELLVQYPECSNWNYWNFLTSFSTNPDKPGYNSPILTNLYPQALSYINSQTCP